MRPRRLALVATAIATIAAARVATQSAALPHLETRGAATQLIVDSRPFLILGGELENDMPTSVEAMPAVWTSLQRMHLNTVLAPISWALIEPEEGRFDFTSADRLIDDARRHQMRLVLLWFGSWKNTLSSYTPSWVKRDLQRFPRVQRSTGAGTERLSPFSVTNRDADARAFAALMRHLKTADGREQTVVLVQVENEVGVIPEARDASAAAEAAFQAPVPRELLSYLQAHKDRLAPELSAKWQASGSRTAGSWSQVFGADAATADLFMAWHFATYINAVAQAGKAEYPLPLFVNAALIRPDYAPGQYNSGGPLPHSIDVWCAGAPAIDFLSPDIYFNVKDWATKYTRSANPLFIPEARAGSEGAVNAFYAIGQHGALGFSPYAVEIDAGADNPLAGVYDVLSQLSPLILEHQTTHGVAGVLLEPLTPSERISLGAYTVTVAPYRGMTGVHVVRDPLPPTAPPAGIIIATGVDEYVIGGAGLTVTFAPSTPGPPLAGLLEVEQGRYEHGVWAREFVLAGDRTAQGAEVRVDPGRPAIQRVRLYRYQ